MIPDDLKKILYKFENTFEKDNKLPVFNSFEEDILNIILPEFEHIKKYLFHLSNYIAFFMIIIILLIPMSILVWITRNLLNVPGPQSAILYFLIIISILISLYILSKKMIFYTSYKIRIFNKKRLFKEIERNYKANKVKIDEILESNKSSSKNEVINISDILYPAIKEQTSSFKELLILHCEINESLTLKDFSLTKIRKFKINGLEKSLDHEVMEKEFEKFVGRITLFYRLSKDDGETRLKNFE